jgi:hypothetical protein
LALDEKVRLWLASHIISEMNSFKEESGEFVVSDYNFEIHKNASLARLDLQELESLASLSSLSSRYVELRSSLDNTELVDWERSNFQFIRIIFKQEIFHFTFYRAPRKTTNKKKYAFFNSNEWELKKNADLELGGAIDFFTIGDSIFINNLRNFEYTFDYSDHIKQKMDENLNIITSLNLFQGALSNSQQFIEQSAKYIYSRSLAQISRQTLTALEANFEDRCRDLQQIKLRYDSISNETEKENMKDLFKEVWPLFDFIDLNNIQIIYNEELKPTTLIHFFADKIVKSFLTNEFKVAYGFE